MGAGRHGADVGVPDIAVVVVTYNSEHVLGGLLDSLPAALEGASADVVIVDNGSSDGTVQLAEQRQDCRLVRATNLGYAAGLNHGIREAARAEAVLVLNPDVRLWPGFLTPMLSALGQDRTGIVAPRIVNPDGTLFYSLRRDPTVRRAMGLNFTGWPAVTEAVSDDEEYENPRVVCWALGAVLLLSRSCLETVGPWDESFFLYSEETEYCLRAHDRGFVTRYEPASVAEHIGGQSGQTAKTHTMMVINRIRLYRRRHGAAASWCFYGASLASELSWVARGRRESRSSVNALLRPSRRPAELKSSSRLLPD